MLERILVAQPADICEIFIGYAPGYRRKGSRSGVFSNLESRSGQRLSGGIYCRSHNLPVRETTPATEIPEEGYWGALPTYIIETGWRFIEEPPP